MNSYVGQSTTQDSQDHQLLSRKKNRPTGNSQYLKKHTQSFCVMRNLEDRNLALEYCKSLLKNLIDLIVCILLPILVSFYVSSYPHINVQDFQTVRQVIRQKKACEKEWWQWQWQIKSRPHTTSLKAAVWICSGTRKPRAGWSSTFRGKQARRMGGQDRLHFLALRSSILLGNMNLKRSKSPRRRLTSLLFLSSFSSLSHPLP